MTLPAHVTVSSCPKAIVILITPVGHIMSAFVAGFSEVANLILLIAGLFHSGHEQQIHLQLIFLIR
ncbi:hypothetical protein D3C85_1456510 [compost metagenome]